MSTKERVDLVLVERGLAESRNMAQRLIMAGQVRANGEVVMKPSRCIDADTILTIDRGPRFVSRGGEKLAAALITFQLSVDGKVCADVGASTGGFTDCLLQHGAARVYAIDVGHGVLDWKLRQDSRVMIMEGTNARYLERLPEAVQLITIDASFISLKVLLPVVKNWFISEINSLMTSKGRIITLIKPQFEAGRQQVGRGKGVIRDPAIHRQVLMDVLDFALQLGYGIRGLIRSPITGPKGNVEFLVWLDYPGEQTVSLEGSVDLVLSETG